MRVAVKERKKQTDFMRLMQRYASAYEFYDTMAGFQDVVARIPVSYFCFQVLSLPFPFLCFSFLAAVAFALRSGDNGISLLSSQSLCCIISIHDSGSW